jgi:putative ABC transport system permease protein
MSDLAREHAETLASRTIVALPIRDALVGNVKPILLSLLVAVGLLLAAMSANLALLMLTRYLERASELAMRTALGATRARILRQLFVESLALSIAGAVLAVAVGRIATRSLVAAIPDGVMISLPYLAKAAPDGRVVGIIAAVAVGLSIVFGIWPAVLVLDNKWQAESARATVTRGNRRIRHALVVTQIAVTVVLLVSSGLLITSFMNLINRDLGVVAPEELVTVRIPLSGARYQPDPAQQQFYETFLGDVARLPGVRSAGLISQVPGGGGRITTIETADHPLPRSAQPQAALRVVGGDYFSTLGIPLRSGRLPESRDRDGTPLVCVVSDSLGRWLSTDGAVIGRKLRLGSNPRAEWEVVGTVRDVQIGAVDAISPPVVYVSHLQAAENRMSLVVRTRAGGEPIARQVREIVRRMDPGIPVYGIATIQQQISDSRAIVSRRLPMMVCGVFACAALLLSLIALYAMCDYEVLTRRREFSIRLALGGSPAGLRRTILSDGLALAVAGIGVGVVAAFVVSRSINAILFGVANTDWRIYSGAAVTVVICAVLTALRPAFSATSVDPAAVMREP